MGVAWRYRKRVDAADHVTSGAAFRSGARLTTTPSLFVIRRRKVTPRIIGYQRFNAPIGVEPARRITRWFRVLRAGASKIASESSSVIPHAERSITAALVDNGQE